MPIAAVTLIKEVGLCTCAINIHVHVGVAQSLCVDSNRQVSQFRSGESDRQVRQEGIETREELVCYVPGGICCVLLLYTFIVYFFRILSVSVSVCVLYYHFQNPFDVIKLVFMPREGERDLSLAERSGHMTVTMPTEPAVQCHP